MCGATIQRPCHERAYYLRRIEAMFKKRGTLTRDDVVTALHLHPHTAGSYLRHMHRDLRMIRKVKRVGSTAIWELGEDPALAVFVEFKTKQRMVPARQVGMWRDSLVAAFFGPARGAVA